MRRVNILLASLVLSVGLFAGCGERKPAEKTVFDAQVQSLKKAREVEDVLQKSAQQREQQLENSQQGEK